MANTRSAKKRVRSSLRKRLRNRARRSAVKTVVARARKATPGDGNPSGAEEVRRAMSALDKAAEKRVLHPNNAARRKSRLMRSLAKLVPAPPAKKPDQQVVAGKAGAERPSRRRAKAES